MNRPMSRAEHSLAALRAHTALAAIRAGHGRQEEWSDIADAINVVEALCGLGKSAAIDDTTSSVLLMGEAMLGYRSSGYMALRDDTPVKRVVSAYDLAMGRLSTATIADAYRIVLARIAHAKEPGSGVEIVE